MGLGAEVCEERTLEGKRLVAMPLMELALMELALTEPLIETESGSRSEPETEGGLVAMRTVDARRTAPRMRDQLDLGEGVGGALIVCYDTAKKERRNEGRKWRAVVLTIW